MPEHLHELSKLKGIDAISVYTHYIIIKLLLIK